MYIKFARCSVPIDAIEGQTNKKQTNKQTNTLISLCYLYMVGIYILFIRLGYRIGTKYRYQHYFTELHQH